MTEIHFAGLNTAAFAEALEGRAVLVSYADVIRRPGVWANEILPRLRAGAYPSAILDSGAFTELTTPGFSVSIEAYVAFCREHGHLFSQVVTLDDIGGDLAKTWKNTAALEGAGVEVVPVFHGREPWAVLEHYCARSKRVGLGFARDAGRIAKDQGDGLSPDAWLAKALDVCERYGVAVHGFGMTRYAAERGHERLTTTDSTTWISEYRALKNRHADAAHSITGDAADLLGPYNDAELLEIVLRSYLGSGADAELDACIAGVTGQARTVLRRFTGEELALVLGHLDAQAAAWRAEVVEPVAEVEAEGVCSFCGEPEVLDVLELWVEERAFLIETCCEAAHEAWSFEMQFWGREEWSRFIEDSTGVRCRNVAPSDSGTLRLDYGLELRPIKLGEAKAFVRKHHRHNPPPVSWRWGHAVYNGPELVAVAMVGRPVARLLDKDRIVEVNRVCAVEPSGEHPSTLVWNACSMLYGAAAREAKRRGFEKIITYTLEEEAGTALRAVGWIPEARTKGGSWSRPSRPREDAAPTCPKVRWAKTLRAERATAASTGAARAA